MIDVYFWPTGNGKKITIMLEEYGLPYNVIPVNINKGDQSTPEYDAINPNNKMPTIIAHAPAGGGTPITVFESGAVLQYLPEKSGQVLPTDTPGKYRVLQWVYRQVGGLGPVAGQAHQDLKKAAP
jgi:GSH-dependent disulfide-bond oxidoreductase